MTPWIAASQASLSITNSVDMPKALAARMSSSALFTEMKIGSYLNAQQYGVGSIMYDKSTLWGAIGSFKVVLKKLV